MPKKRANIKLSTYDDIFSTEEERQEEKLEKIQMISLSELYPFKNHPFRVLNDEAMQKTVESVAEHGVLTPAIARPRPEGGYELISGHRRKMAAELAGLEVMPVIVRDLDDDEATILMVDANLQREEILPSERAKAYKMKADALRHQGQRNDLNADRSGELTSSQLETKLRADEEIGRQTGQSRAQVQRYIRLNYLNKGLLDMVDQGKISLTPAVELSYLPEEEQKKMLEAMDYAQATPSLSQSQRMRKLSKDGHLSFDAMCAVLTEEKKPVNEQITLGKEVLNKYFPKSYTPKEMERTIIRLLDQWQHKRSRGLEH